MTAPADEQLPPSQVKRPTGCLSGGISDAPNPFTLEEPAQTKPAKLAVVTAK